MVGGVFPRLTLVAALVGAGPASGIADPVVVPLPPEAQVLAIPPAKGLADINPSAGPAATTTASPPAASPPPAAAAPAKPAPTAAAPAASAAPVAVAPSVAAPGGAATTAAAPANPPPPVPLSHEVVRGVDAAALQAALQGSDSTIDGRTADKATLNAVYQPHGFAPVWTEAREEAFAAALGNAAAQGLDASAYKVTATKPVARELLLTDAFLRYAAALAHGRVSPKDFETDWRIDPPPFDAPHVFDAAMAGEIGAVLAGLAPHEPEYERLLQALQRYETLAQKPWHVLFSPTSIEPGAHGAIVQELRDRLTAEGYYDGTKPVDDPTRYGPDLAAAVSRFQATHGLPVDGAVGKLTLAALNISPALRARQIRWNLERWRSLPRIDAPERIEINAAAATATLFADGEPVRVMKAIVGASVHPTPVLRARMRSVLLNPPWIVPSSIIKNEIRPMLLKDPNYLQRFGFSYQEINGSKELVQHPGPGNSLGLVKFEMPNADDVYMHDTPERRLFALSRRYISHGCVRVEDPRELARILIDSDKWSRDAIDAAIATGQTQKIPLRKTLPVYALYFTAFVDPDGTVEFRDDVYGRDRRLAEALAARAAADRLAANSVKEQAAAN
ncbi:MAG TPA: L,D-transpeptidase family protein [Stellaceae bacterium]|nr:L,D-transpeptidase family protein [Stellaceae bacterium]